MTPHTHDHPCPPHPQRRQGHIAEVSKVSIRHVEIGEWKQGLLYIQKMTENLNCLPDLDTNPMERSVDLEIWRTWLEEW